MAVEIGLFMSLVLSTLESPTSDFVMARSVFTCAGVRFVHTQAFLWIISSLEGVSHAMAVRSLSSG